MTYDDARAVLKRPPVFGDQQMLDAWAFLLAVDGLVEIMAALPACKLCRGSGYGTWAGSEQYCAACSGTGVSVSHITRQLLDAWDGWHVDADVRLAALEQSQRRRKEVHIGT